MTDLPLQPQIVPLMGCQSPGSFGQKSPWPPVSSLRCFSKINQTVIIMLIYVKGYLCSNLSLLLYFLMEKPEYTSSSLVFCNK